MAEAAPLWVEYPADDPAAPSVVVERLDSAAIDLEMAGGVARLIRDAYVAQFGGTYAPRSAFEQAYNPDDADAVARRRDTMVGRIQAGEADYWVVCGDEPGHLEGLARVVPEDQKLYIGDILVTPPWQRGIGSRVLHAALTHSGLNSSVKVYLDGFQGSGVNDWYVRLGIAAGQLSGHHEIGSTGYRILMREYATPAAVGLGGVVRALETKRPSLTQATVHYTSTSLQ